jgi:hypothetical protein
MALFHLETALGSAKLPLRSGAMHFCRAETTIRLLPAVIAPQETQRCDDSHKSEIVHTAQEMITV